MMPIIVVGIIVAMIVWITKELKTEKLVLEKSKQLQSLLTLNQSIQFKKITKLAYSEHFPCNSKRKLEHLSLDDCLMYFIESNIMLRNTIVDIEFNKKEYQKYMVQTKKITSSATEKYCSTFGFTLDKFLKYETRLFKQNLLREPKCNLTVRCVATYTSPQGRNHYSKSHIYQYYDIKRFYEQGNELKKQRKTRKYQIMVERAKMTDSLRYDILKRDNYRCQICGSTAQDGVKLHVDHIVPVSKGGQTIPSNLQTLCDRCNLGKSDKI